MWFKIFLILWAIHANLFRCSLVIDKTTQEGIYLNDFCPKMKYCPEGSHTMCLYYNPDRIFGPRCSGFKNISVNPEIAEHMLGLVNEIRGRVAMGLETGKGNVTLPRAYGMFKLKWDNELATFAQVLANTCILRRDLCRATKRFANPGQLVSLVRFTIPDWQPWSQKVSFPDKRLTPERITYTTNEACKLWYRDKQHVSLDMLKQTPDWSTAISSQGRLFMQLADGKATHMGCGVSSYIEYKFQGTNPEQIIFNSIHVICNFSTQPRKGKVLYRTDKPTAEDLCPQGDQRCISRYKSKCGCPPDFAEDDRCLCTEPIPYKEKSACEKNKCKPAVVLLPIFTVEDAPQKLTNRKRMENIDMHPTYDERQPVDSNEWEHNEVLEKYRRKHNLGFDNILKPAPVTHVPTPSRDLELQRPTDGSQRLYIMNSIEPPYTKTRVGHLYERQSNEDNDSFLLKQIRQETIDEKHYNLGNSPTRLETFDEKHDNIKIQPNDQESFNEKYENIRNQPAHRESFNEKYDNIRNQPTQRESFDDKHNNIQNQPTDQEYFNEKYDNIPNQLTHRESFNEKQDNIRKQPTHREFLKEKHDNPRNQPNHLKSRDEKRDKFQNQKKKSSSQKTQRKATEIFSPPQSQQSRREPAKKGTISSRRFSQVKNNKQSIFSRSPRFELHSTGKQIKNSVKMDVAPRRDFSNAKQALDKYLSEKRHKELRDEVQNVEQNIEGVEPDTNKLTATIRPRFKSSIINTKNRHNQTLGHNSTKMSTKPPSMKQYLKKKFQFLGFDVNDEALKHVDDSNDIKESDKKLMMLLDNLEQEAQHVDLNGNEKEMFDAKLKKIYGSIVKNNDTFVPKANKFEISEEKLSEAGRNQNDKSLKYQSDEDDATFYDNTDDPNKDEFDKQMYDTEDIATDLHSKDHDMSVQSLYAKPLPRDQNTLRPIVKDKMDYVFRNTFNDVNDFEKKNIKKKHKRNNRHSISKFLENKKRNEDEVKSLPYKLEYGKKNKGQKYKNLRKYKDKEKKHRPDDERGRYLNQIDEQTVRYEDEVSDYEDDKQIHLKDQNDKPYGKDYEKDYPEDPLSAERRRFYQEKLDKLRRRKYSTDSDKPGHKRGTGRKRRPMRGLRRSGRNGSPRYYLPNRASRHGFQKRL